MGMYTSLVVSAKLKESTPELVLTTIRRLHSGDIDVKDVLGSKAHRNPLSAGCAHTPGGLLDLRYSEYSSPGELSITINSSLKNYDGEIELFLDWLRPHVESGHGAREWWALVTYEESDAPTVYYLEPE